MTPPLPAHDTKHVPLLKYTHLGHTFHLVQSDDGRSNGTALWLGAQILSLYLACHHKPTGRRPRAVELGSGVGLTALVLSAIGYDVLATDTAHVCDSVLRYNVTANLPHLPANAGSIQVRELDWNAGSEGWSWADPMRITPGGDVCSKDNHGAGAEDLLGPPFDLIVSSDTLYDMSLVEPFFRAVRALAVSSRPKAPAFFLGLERRDPQLIDAALACAPMPLTRVPARKVRKTLARGGLSWAASEWEGVEIWTSWGTGSLVPDRGSGCAIVR